MIRKWLSFFRAQRLPTWRELPMVLAKVISFGMAVGIVFSLAATLIAGYPIPLSALPAFLLFVSAIGAIFSLSFHFACGIPNILVRNLLADQPDFTRRVLMALAGGINAALAFLLAAAAISGLFGNRITFLGGRKYLGVILLFEAVLGAFISTVIMMVTHARARRRQAEQELLQARFLALQSQINPHFLFNTLNSISALVPRRPDAAQEMIGRLADMFRYALESQSQVVTLDEEMAFVKNYLALEQIRFSDRLQVQFETADLAGVKLPGLTIQPIVENAVKYGIAQRIDGGWVELKVDRCAGRCRVSVRNQFDTAVSPDLSDNRLFREGHALYNVRERLRIQWNGRSAVRVERDGADWVNAIVEFPVEA